VPGILQVHEQVPGLLDDSGLDRMLRGAQDPDAPAAVLDYRKDVHLRAIEQVSGEEVQREDSPGLGSQELRPPRAVPGAEPGMRFQRDSARWPYGHEMITLLEHIGEPWRGKPR
jgi:hypothetical protein